MINKLFNYNNKSITKYNIYNNNNNNGNRINNIILIRKLSGNNVKNVNNIINSYKQELNDIRKHLHSYPELAFNEYKTSDFIYDKLMSYGVDNIKRNIGKTVGYSNIYIEIIIQSLLLFRV